MRVDDLLLYNNLVSWKDFQNYGDIYDIWPHWQEKINNPNTKCLIFMIQWKTICCLWWPTLNNNSIFFLNLVFNCSIYYLFGKGLFIFFNSSCVISNFTPFFFFELLFVCNFKWKFKCISRVFICKYVIELLKVLFWILFWLFCCVCVLFQSCFVCYFSFQKKNVYFYFQIYFPNP